MKKSFPDIKSHNLFNLLPIYLNQIVHKNQLEIRSQKAESISIRFLNSSKFDDSLEWKTFCSQLDESILI